MELIPVLDLCQGRVVRGVAGRRAEYRSNISRLCPDAEPLATLSALRRAFSPSMFYIADLDGLERGQPQWNLLAELAAEAPVSVDAGIVSPRHAEQLLTAGVSRIIVSLETLTDWTPLREILSIAGPDRTLFSLDLQDGRPLGGSRPDANPLEIIAEVEQLGIWQVIVLDLAHVGVGRGVPTIALCHSLRRRHPELQIWTGGGVRNIADLYALASTHVDGAMVASALHDGGIIPEDWAALRALDDDLIQLATDA